MGSRKRFLAVAAFVAIGAAACFNGDASANQAADALKNASDEITDEQALCVGHRLEDGLTQEQLNEVAGSDDLAELAGKEVVGSDTDQDLSAFVRDALARCLGDPDSEPTQDEPTEDGNEENGEAGDES